MLTRLWTIGIKVPNLEKELAFHRSMGNPLVLDETLEVGGEGFRVPLIRMGDKYIHLAEKMVYESLLDRPLPFGITHVVYRSDKFEEDVRRASESGARLLRDVAIISAGFGERRVAFFTTPSGWIFEIIEVLRDLVPEV
jgi:catechol 2,3-dioxygenase-like lactoylglutathione lyase family enzyme